MLTAEDSFLCKESMQCNLQLQQKQRKKRNIQTKKGQKQKTETKQTEPRKEIYWLS